MTFNSRPYSLVFKKKSKIFLFFIFFSFGTSLSKLPTSSLTIPTLETSEVIFAKSSKTSPNGMNFLASVSMELDKVGILSFLEHYSEVYEFPFFIDRRVDPTTPLSGSFTNVPFVLALDQMFREASLSYCIVNNLFLYVGPSNAAGEALLLFNLKREQLKDKIPRQVVEKLNTYVSFEILPYAKPSDSFSLLSQCSHLKFSGYEKTPFDRWRGEKFSKVSVTDMLTVMGLGFNVDYRYDISTGTIKPTTINRNQKILRYYPRFYGAQINQKKYSNCAFVETTFNGESVIRVSGFFNELSSVEYEYAQIRRKDWSEQVHNFLDSNISSKTLRTQRLPKPSKGKNFRFEITGVIVNKTLKTLFNYLKNNLEITCILDSSMEKLNITLDTRITCEFNHSNIKEVASIIASQIGAVTKIDNTQITFMAK